MSLKESRGIEDGRLRTRDNQSRRADTLGRRKTRGDGRRKQAKITQLSAHSPSFTYLLPRKRGSAYLLILVHRNEIPHDDRRRTITETRQLCRAGASGRLSPITLQYRRANHRANHHHWHRRRRTAGVGGHLESPGESLCRVECALAEIDVGRGEYRLSFQAGSRCCDIASSGVGVHGK